MHYEDEMDKHPREYAPYRSTLDECDRALAAQDLHENEDTRDSSIAQLREFIAKHPQIVRCRTDAVFLLRFLRYRKFNVADACATLEGGMAFLMRMRTLYGDEVNTFHPNVLRMLDLDAIVPLGFERKRRMAILVRVGAMDPKETTALLQMRLGALVINTCLEYERTQVHGTVWIVDCSGMTMAHVGAWGLTEVKMMADSINEVVTMFVKEVHMVQVPRITWMLLDILLPLLSPKIRDRFKFHRTRDELRNSVDPSILPTTYGGQQSLKQATDNFRRMFETQTKWFKLEEQFLMDLSVPAPGAGGRTARNNQRNEFPGEECMVGSFRKLTVD
ncbi:alpha-tocopherol transfer protein-like [Anopheles marshallii]|uniref:alpha-tocopherol transfer protein-like n=1 Tax=Anopheles marshallii TaxID=1521116 RepID=UPI00237A3EB1|nr:alpha-tocopherol transfer protein-like [Anopheles marshallii]